MNITFTNNNKELPDILPLDISSCLDKIWQQPWIQRSITKTDVAEISLLKENIAPLLSCDTIIILSEEETSPFIKALSDMIPSHASSPDIKVFTANLSTYEYTKLFKSMSGRKTAFAPVALSTESLEFKCAYSTIKKFISDNRMKCGGFNFLGIYGDSAEFTKNDVSAAELPYINLKWDFSIFECANSPLASLLIMMKGGKVEDYLKGFYNAISSPLWDKNAPDFAISLINDFLKIRRHNVNYYTTFSTAQKELKNTCQWLSQMASSILDSQHEIKSRFINTSSPNKSTGEENNIYICSKVSHKDIMTPFFPGCHEDGSMDMLREESLKKLYEDSPNNTKWVSVSDLKEENAGQLTAYLQLSINLIKELYNNTLQ